MIQIIDIEQLNFLLMSNGTTVNWYLGNIIYGVILL